MARESKHDDTRNYSPLVTVLWGGVACGMVALAALASLFWWEFLTPLNQHTVKTLPQTQGQSQPSQPVGGTTPAPAPDTAPQQDPADSGQTPPVEPDASGSDDAAAQPPGGEEPESQQPDVPPDQPPAPQGKPDSGKGQNTTSSSAGTSGGKADTGSSSNQSGLVLNPSNENDTGGTPSTPPNNTGSSQNTGNSSSSGTAAVDNGGSDENETYEDKFAKGMVMITTASNNSNDPVYHTKLCRSAKAIQPEDVDWYASAGDAEAAGRRICGNCD